jgi:mono/diheme cytochrome c family protein
MGRGEKYPGIGFLAASLALASLAVAQQKRAKVVDVEAAFERVPVSAARAANPYEGNPDALAAGRKLFLRHCAECHGDDARGSEKAPNLEAQFLQQAAAGDLFWMVRNGNLRRGMPAWSRLPDAQIWQIVTHLKSLPPGPPEPAAGSVQK